MCIKRRHLYVCGHDSIREGMCSEAENNGEFGNCEFGYSDQSDKGLPVEERSFCSNCPGLSVPTKEELNKQRCERKESIREYKEQLKVAIEKFGRSERNHSENKRAIGDAAYNVAFYTERDRWLRKVEDLEDEYRNDAERLKDGRDKLLDEFEKNTQDIQKDLAMFNEEMYALLASEGWDQARFLPNRGNDLEFALDNKW
ncbi:5082bf8e-35f4-4ed2-98d3-bf045ee52fe0-CDS [Sclerotinia trifoliorum]|uniref:5082bf8e-35f4-4ed2-98d3-bf045ee52fe0-CDS n=1 Tax=Sclerotinia trifoliorum TaxID=28548 RepID=A0A8H2VXS9_9HELO|nr:5082bf8e-35f4-4ed2-98d3-bf045ee52fe0-CDS [Sclerotinia trifoliorum]